MTNHEDNQEYPKPKITPQIPIPSCRHVVIKDWLTIPPGTEINVNQGTILKLKQPTKETPPEKLMKLEYEEYFSLTKFAATNFPEFYSGYGFEGVFSDIESNYCITSIIKRHLKHVDKIVEPSNKMIALKTILTEYLLYLEG